MSTSQPQNLAVEAGLFQWEFTASSRVNEPLASPPQSKPPMKRHRSFREILRELAIPLLIAEVIRDLWNGLREAVRQGRHHVEPWLNLLRLRLPTRD